jgi:predicted ribosome-associated RNA-binding protein Tma20
MEGSLLKLRLTYQMMKKWTRTRRKTSTINQKNSLAKQTKTSISINLRRSIGRKLYERKQALKKSQKARIWKIQTKMTMMKSNDRVSSLVLMTLRCGKSESRKTLKELP